MTALLLWRRPALVRRALSLIVPRTSRLQDRVGQLHALEEQIYTSRSGGAACSCRSSRAEVMFHVLGVLEVHLTWWLIQGAAPPLLTSFIFEGANRLVQVLFKFVPLRTGVDELTTGSFTRDAGLRRRAGTPGDRAQDRTIAWVLVGTTLLSRRSTGVLAGGLRIDDSRLRLEDRLKFSERWSRGYGGPPSSSWSSIPSR